MATRAAGRPVEILRPVAVIAPIRINEKLLKRVEKKVRKQKTTVAQLVRDYFERYAQEDAA